ncbi:MAG: hypothetical protein PHG04_04215 [Candidatus Nanoarchaeia archaeon]|nr:hypothetical protein [Candidatus Nanoarchaeia archaeon]MDD5054550.1 hypothetical protein [Candidatus Nanoarchaeia archaeon]
MNSGISYFKRFKLECFKRESEMFSSAKYYSRQVHECIDSFSINHSYKKNKAENNDALSIISLESMINRCCPLCKCSVNCSSFCAQNLIASLNKSKSIPTLKDMYFGCNCSTLISDLTEEFIEFGMPRI